VSAYHGAATGALLSMMSTFKAKFHYAIWFEAGSKLVADRFEAKFHSAICSQTGPELFRSWTQTCSELKFGLSSSLLAAN